MSMTQRQRAPALGLLSITDASRLAGVHRDDIDCAMRNGRLRYQRIDGRRWTNSTALGEYVVWMNGGVARRAK
jgi:hypothetical protein